MLDLIKSIPGILGGVSSTQWAVGAGLTLALTIFTKKMPKDKLAGWIKLLSEYLNGVVRTAKIVATGPSKYAGVQLSDKILKYVPKKIAGKLEEGFFMTIAFWLKEAWAVVVSFVSEIFNIPIDMIDAFIEGLRADNEKKKK